MAKAKQSRRRWSDKEKAAMVAWAEQHGFSAAAEKYNVSTTLLYDWRKRLGKQTGTAMKAAPAKAPAKARRPRKATASPGQAVGEEVLMRAMPTDTAQLQRLVLDLLLENRKLRG